LDVDADHSGEVRGGEFGGEGEQRGRAVLPWPEADLLEALARSSAGSGVERQILG
jgi:hypothetical protein